MVRPFGKIPPSSDINQTVWLLGKGTPLMQSLLQSKGLWLENFEKKFLAILAKAVFGKEPSAQKVVPSGSLDDASTTLVRQRI